MTALAIDHQPNFPRFRATLLGEQSWQRPPLFDFHIHRTHKQRWLGKDELSPADECAFYAQAGYDYVQGDFHLRPDEVEQHVRQKIDRLNATGGYIPGISTVLDRVRFENYQRMIETVYSYPDEPVAG